MKKYPTVVEKHVVIINGKEHMLKKTSWTESLVEVIHDGFVPNTIQGIKDYIEDCAND